MHTRWIRPAALILLALIFWLDTVTPMGIAVPSLYVAPVLLTGLGLAIVRRLVLLQGGTVALLPRAGGGAVARITLPSARSSQR